MTFKPEKKSLNILKELPVVTAQQSIPVEISLPDYCSDIKRILKCVVEPGITSVSVNGENVSVSGSVNIKLIYVGEKDKIDCCEVQKDLSVTARIKDLPGEAAICPRAKTNYVNCRATSQRRISAEVNIGVSFDTYSRDVREVLIDCGDSTFELKKQETDYENLICIRDKVFDMGETLQVPQDKGCIGKILHTYAYAVVDSQKAVSDKLLIKGQLYTQVLYRTDSDEGRISKLYHTMPISQIIDLPGIDETSLCNVRLGVRYLSVQRKTDSSDNCLAEIGAKVAATVRCSTKEKVQVIEDCYSTTHEIKTDYSSEDFFSHVHTANQQKTLKQTLDFSASDIADVTDIWCSDVTSSMTGKGDSAKGESSITLCLIWLDSKGVPQYGEKNVVLPFDIKLKENYESLRCDYSCQVRNIDFTVMSKDKIEVKVECGVRADIYCQSSRRLLKNIEILSEKDDSDMSALTIYFPFKGEKLWDIARRYSTTAKAIKEENGIEGDFITKEEMILV